MTTYQEPALSILVLDFVKEAETRACLESVKRHILFPHKIIYLHNGIADYPIQLYRDGLVDQFIQTRHNHGLGVGTRDLVAACFSRYFLMLQNDQVIGRDFSAVEFDGLIHAVLGENINGQTIASVDLAGAVGGRGVYSERAHIMETAFYKQLETDGKLGTSGAGPYHEGAWREAQIQEFYRENDYTHFTWPNPLVIDRGVWTIRDVAGGRVRMRTDTKAVWWLEPPKHPYVFPECSELEWATAIDGKWIDGTIPQAYLDKKQSFNCWGDVTP